MVPSGLTASESTELASAGNAGPSCWCVAAFQSRTVSSGPAVISVFPSGEKAT
jgi:hypothetical protein